MSCSAAALVFTLLTGARSQPSTVQAIAGRVVGASSGAERAVQYWQQPSNEWRTVICDPDGSFTIEGLSAPAPVLLHAVQKLPLEAGDFDLSGTGSPEWQRASPGQSVAPGTRGVELCIPPASRYRLRVVDAGSALPLAGVRIGLLGVFDFETGGVPEEVRAEGDGVYSLTLHRPDEHDGLALAVACERYGRMAVGELPFAPGVTQHLGTVELTALAPTELLVVGDTDARPIEGAVVTASIESNDDGCLNAHMVGTWPARRALPDGWSGTTTADGTATAYLSSRQAYWIGVERPGYAHLWYRVVTNPRPPQRVELRLLRPATITVRCVDERTGEPLADEVVAYEQVDTFDRDYVRTGSDGTVCIENLIPGSYRVWPEDQDREQGTVVAVGAGGGVEVTLSIRWLARDR